MTAPTEIRQKAIALLEGLPGSSLVKAVEFLEALSDEVVRGSGTQSPEDGEVTLLQIIQHHLSPEDRERLAYLRQQNETGTITDTEHQELLMYVDRVERQDSDRAEALIKLAQLRKVDLKVLINEFLPTASNAA
jgi:hypothetical protein